MSIFDLASYFLCRKLQTEDKNYAYLNVLRVDFRPVLAPVDRALESVNRLHEDGVICPSPFLDVNKGEPDLTVDSG